VKEVVCICRSFSSVVPVSPVVRLEMLTTTGDTEFHRVFLGVLRVSAVKTDRPDGNVVTPSRDRAH
jgi:hypothetical protein